MTRTVADTPLVSATGDRGTLITVSYVGSPPEADELGRGLMTVTSPCTGFVPPGGTT